MNCCDYNCTQGRDCPARKGYAQRKVRAGSTPPPDDLVIDFAGDEPAEPSPMDYFSELVSSVLFVLFLVCAVAAAMSFFGVLK